jgi:hypothetical protein
LSIRKHQYGSSYKNITSKEDIKILSDLAKRLGLKSTPLSLEEKEDIAMGMLSRMALNQDMYRKRSNEDTSEN